MTRPIPVCVFAKPPIPGRSKTRLARAIGDDRAAAIAGALLLDTWDKVRSLRWARPVLAATTDDLAAYGVEGDVEIWPQGEGDLGARMERVLARGVAEAGEAILVGGDVPGLPGAHLEAARDALAAGDAVLGPAEDGGFYLIGLARVPAGLLADLPWSRPDTRAETARRLAAHGLAPALLPPWFDLDEPGDLAAAHAALEVDPSAGPRTIAALRALAAR